MSSPCGVCTKAVYFADAQLKLDGVVYHNHCCKCCKCGCQISIKNFVRSSEGQLYCRTHFPLRQTAFTAGKGVSVGKETLGGFKSVEMKGKKGGKLMPSSDSGATISAPTPATTTTTKSSTALVVYLPPTDQHPVTALDKVITGSDYSLASALATDDADLLFAVGFLYYSQGGFSEAEPLYKKSLEIKQTKLGNQHPETLAAMNGVAELFQSMGRFEEAESIYLTCIGIRESKGQPPSEDDFYSINNLAFLYECQGRYEEAETLYKKNLSMRETVYGPDHPDTLNSMNNLAGLYGFLGQFKEAEELMLKCLAITEKKLGPENPETLLATNNLATMYYSQGKYDMAEVLLVKAVQVSTATLGPDHPSTLLLNNNLFMSSLAAQFHKKMSDLFSNMLVRAKE